MTNETEAKPRSRRYIVKQCTDGTWSVYAPSTPEGARCVANLDTRRKARKHAAFCEGEHDALEHLERRTVAEAMREDYERGYSVGLAHLEIASIEAQTKPLKGALRRAGIEASK